MEARELRYFVAVAEELHFGRAARRLSIAAPALSRAVRRTEVDLGVKLFERDAHRVTLTDAGEALVGQARDAIASLDEALAAAREAGRRELVGSLSVGVSPLLRHRVAPAFFERFAGACPGVHVARRDELSGPLVEELRARQIDAALAFCPPRHDDLAYEPIRDAELVVMVASAHPLAGRVSVSLAELRDESFLVPSHAAAPAVRRRFAELFEAAGFQGRYATRAVDHDEELDSVRKGYGVMLISRFFLETAPAGTRLLELNPPAPLAFELVRRRERPSPTLARFVEVVHEVGASEELGSPDGAERGTAVDGRKAVAATPKPGSAPIPDRLRPAERAR
jgi:DNA-binding transcriptional LysR family regulator